jgi:hypothetical protein
MDPFIKKLVTSVDPSLKLDVVRNQGKVANQNKTFYLKDKKFT